MDFLSFQEAKPIEPADQMDDTRLHDGLREDGIDRIRKALETIDHRDQDIGHAPVLEFVHDP